MLPPAIKVNTCYDGLVIKIHGTLLDLMRDHLAAREGRQAEQVDTVFDTWLHEQILDPTYNST